MEAKEFLQGIKAARWKIEALTVDGDDMAAMLAWAEKRYPKSKYLHMMKSEITGINNDLMQVKAERARRVEFLQCVPGLSDTFRRLLILHYVDELTLAAAAERLFYSADYGQRLHRKAVAALDMLMSFYQAAPIRRQSCRINRPAAAKTAE